MAFGPIRGEGKFAKAHWIWGAFGKERERPAGEACRLTATFTLPSAARSAPAWASADNHFRLFVNGKEAGAGDDWTQPVTLDLAPLLRVGANRIDALCWNDSSAAGFLFALHGKLADGSALDVESDERWRAGPIDGAAARQQKEVAAEPPAEAAHSFGEYGCAPWGNLEIAPAEDRFEPRPGFRVDAVASGLGSVINLALDPQGRLCVAAEGRGVVRVTDRDGDGTFESVETLTQQITYCQGLLCESGVLYTTGNGPNGCGLYRVPEATGVPECLGRFEGGMGEHGPHAIVRGPDGLLYLAIGNHASLAEPIAADSPLSPLRYEGYLLPRYVDPRGHAVQCRAPGGVIARYDERRREWQLFAGGYRNHYDLAFDEHGALFTFDSDMEWDVGLPWYRAVRFVHVVPGGEYGWRTGSSDWPSWYADSLPPAVETDRGSPTGMCCYTGTQFPARFRGAILAGDWSQGQILAFHPHAHGATYDATVEVLLRGRPLNVTDVVVARDGSILFAVGGRGTAGGVYRLSYTGPPDAALAAATDGGDDVAATPAYDAATPTATLLAALGSEDRFVRFLASRALERRDPAGFEHDALALPSALARAEALIALARARYQTSDPEAWRGEVAAATKLVESEKSGPALITALRALELLFLGKDGAATAAQPEALATIGRTLSPVLLQRFPTGAREADRELAQLLAFLDDPAAAARIHDVFVHEPSRVEQIWDVYCLRCCRKGMTPAIRTEAARWLDRAIAEWSGGASFEGYLRDLRGDFDALLTEGERAELAAEAAKGAGAHAVVTAGAAREPRDLDEVASFVEKTLGAPRRSVAEGARLFGASCANCHQVAGRGKAVGPDLTTAAGRLNVRDLLEAILVPSKAISDQYRATNFFLKGGDIVAGIPTLDDGRRLVVVESNGLPHELKAADVESRSVSQTSLMPVGLIDGLTLEEVADLVAYVLGGRAVEPANGSLWRPLLAADSLAGFEGDPAAFELKDGVLHAHSPGGPMPQVLRTQESLGDFMVEFDLRLADPAAEGGLSFRGRAAADGALTGYRAVAGAEKWGALAEDGGRGVIQRPRYEIWHALARMHDWNHFVVTALGDHIVIEHNGIVTVDLTDPDGPRGGLLGFVLPAGAPAEFAVRDLRLRVADLVLPR